MKNSETIKKRFILAAQNHQKNNFVEAETLYKEVLSMDSNHYEATFYLGTLYGQYSNFEMALNWLTKASKIRSNDVHVHINLGNVLKELKKYSQSIISYERAITIDPSVIHAHNNLGIVLKEQLKYTPAIKCFEKVIELNPKYLSAYNNIGTIFGELKNFNKAKYYFEKAIKIEPNYPASYYNLGLIFQEFGNYKKSCWYYNETIKLQPNHADAHNNLGIIFQEQGEFKKAENSFEKAIQYNSENLSYLYQLSILKNEVLNKSTKNNINRILNLHNCTKKNLAYGNLILSKYARKEKDFEKAFKYLIKGHNYYFDSKGQKFIQGVNYCFNKLTKVNKIISIKKNIEKNKKKIFQINPIFIVGVPRSGTTLIEKIIASGYNKIPIGEETGIFGNLVGEEIFNSEKVDLNLEKFKKKLIEQYNEKKLIQAHSKYTFTDKSLDNFFYIELIKKIFPNAKIVNCRRDPTSSIMSILENNLIEISWAHNLEDIFKYFNIYNKIIEDYKKKMPNFIYDLKYEKFVKNPEVESKKLMNFCGLLWDKKCLEFYKRKDLISKTTSNIQIRKAIYEDSKSKYLPYKKLLQKFGKVYHWFK